MISPQDLEQIVQWLQTHPNFAIGPGQIRSAEESRLIGATGNPAFANSWVAAGGAWADPSFWKDNGGLVHLRGSTKSGTIGLAAFTLPLGYRPDADRFFPCASYDGAAYAVGAVTITSAGVVTPVAGNNTLVGLDGIIFRAQ